MRVLGIANGTLDGNSEVLLKAALTAAAEANASITVSWIHAPSVSIPKNPKPLAGTQDISFGSNEYLKGQESEAGAGPDDRLAVLNAILDADALIFATPVYSHQPAGTLKALVDRIMGPFTDAALAFRALERKQAGDPQFKDIGIDERLPKPRVVGFIAVAGSTTTDQVTMALPTLHLLVYSVHAKVVDQCILLGYGSPGAVVSKNNGEAIRRAQQLGRNVASQIGKKFDDAMYLGPEPAGACPYCHLSKIDLFCTKENDIGCVTCGAEGKLIADTNGVFRPSWKEKSGISCIKMAGKLKHLDDIAMSSMKDMQEIKSDAEHDQKREQWRKIVIPNVALSK